MTLPRRHRALASALRPKEEAVVEGRDPVTWLCGGGASIGIVRRAGLLVAFLSFIVLGHEVAQLALTATGTSRRDWGAALAPIYTAVVDFGSLWAEDTSGEEGEEEDTSVGFSEPSEDALGQLGEVVEPESLGDMLLQTASQLAGWRNIVNAADHANDPAVSAGMAAPRRGDAGAPAPAPAQLSTDPTDAAPGEGAPQLSTGGSKGKTRAGAAALPQKYECPAGRRYLHLMNAREGMSAWIHIVYEMMSLARELNRTLVEPCVLGGSIVPCAPGLVIPVPSGLREVRDKARTVGALSDPLAVPAFVEDCGSAGTPDMQRSRGRSFPLSLYMDMDALRRGGAKIIPFAEWVECELTGRGSGEITVHTASAAGAGAVSAADLKKNIGSSKLARLIVRAPAGYCVTRKPVRRSAGDGKRCSNRVGPYAFDKVWSPLSQLDGPLPNEAELLGDTAADLALQAAAAGRPSSPTLLEKALQGSTATRLAAYSAHMTRVYGAVLARDARTNMFFYDVWRGTVRRWGTFRRLPQFNNIHRAAVALWLRERVNPATVRPPSERARKARAIASVLAVGGMGGGLDPGADLDAWGDGMIGTGAAPPQGQPVYAVFQWRSETVGVEKLAACATEMARRANAISATFNKMVSKLAHKRGGKAARKGQQKQQVASAAEEEGEGWARGLHPPSGGGPGVGATPPAPPGSSYDGVLVSDLPAFNNPCRQWRAYGSSSALAAEGAQRRAAGALLASKARLAKYDADHPGIDSGVLSIRDWLLALHAHQYVSCLGSDDLCRSCFRGNSKYVGRIAEARNQLGHRNLTQWFGEVPVRLKGAVPGQGSAAAAPPPMGPPPLPGAGSLTGGVRPVVSAPAPRQQLQQQNPP